MLVITSRLGTGKQIVSICFSEQLVTATSTFWTEKFSLKAEISIVWCEVYFNI